MAKRRNPTHLQDPLLTAAVKAQDLVAPSRALAAAALPEDCLSLREYMSSIDLVSD